MAKVLPPGLNASTFAAALSEMRDAIGAQWVFSEEADLETYRDPYSLRWGDADEYLASAAVAPDTVEQVQAIVKIANKYKFPLYPISTGKNLTYGGAAPTFTGSVVVDLKRMNRVLKVDDKRNFCLVEPGVSYFDLYRHIQERGLKVWIDCPDPGWGSPVGNALDHGIGYTATPFRDHFGAHCGMEVVLPTGEVMRTGMGALPSADTWQEYRYGVGPHVDGLFTQANFGIVTKMGFWLFPQPESYLKARVTVPNYGDLGPLVDTVNYLEDSMIMTGHANYFSPHGPMFTVGQPDPDLNVLLANGWPSREQIDAFVKAKGKPCWGAELQFYGPPKLVQASWEYAQQRIAQAIPGAKFEADEPLTMPLTAEQQKTQHLVNFGIPNMSIFAMIARRPDQPDAPVQGHVDFLGMAPRNAEAVFKAQRVFFETQRAHGVPIMTTPFTPPIPWIHRIFIVAVTIDNYRDDPAKNAKARALFESYVKNLADAGFGEYRTNPAMQDLLVAQYSFGNHALLRFQERLKDAADPNGIISPGRYGIWPKHLRRNGA
jgi:4-cresol dehydrogenase (hydroxylating)